MAGGYILIPCCLVPSMVLHITAKGTSQCHHFDLVTFCRAREQLHVVPVWFSFYINCLSMVLYKKELHQGCWSHCWLWFLMHGCIFVERPEVSLSLSLLQVMVELFGSFPDAREVLSKWLCTREGGCVVLVLSCVSRASCACSGAGVFVAADRAGGCDWFRLNTLGTRDAVLFLHGSVSQAAWIPLLILHLSSVTITCSHNIFVPQSSCC